MKAADAAKLERLMVFCEKEAKSLRERIRPGMRWAEDKAADFDAIKEILQGLRATIQMTTVGGKVIKELPPDIEEVVTEMEAAAKAGHYFEMSGRDLHLFIEWARKS